MPIFRPAHLLLLSGIGISAVALAVLCRVHWISQRAARLALAIVLTVNEIIWSPSVTLTKACT